MRQTVSFPAELRSAASARHHAEALLDDWGLDEAKEVVRLLVSELVVNAVLHAGSGPRLTMDRAPGRVRVEVADTSRVLPVKREFSPSSPTGRGLLILDDLADEWGVDLGEQGKTVWFELAVADGDRTGGDGSSRDAAS